MWRLISVSPWIPSRSVISSIIKSFFENLRGSVGFQCLSTRDSYLAVFEFEFPTCV